MNCLRVWADRVRPANARRRITRSRFTPLASDPALKKRCSGCGVRSGLSKMEVYGRWRQRQKLPDKQLDLDALFWNFRRLLPVWRLLRVPSERRVTRTLASRVPHRHRLQSDRIAASRKRGSRDPVKRSVEMRKKHFGEAPVVDCINTLGHFLVLPPQDI